MSAENKKEAKHQWLERQEQLASDCGLAISIVTSSGLKSVAESNNNSICSVLSNSEQFADSCGQYCGKVFEQSLKTKKPFKYKCHAGLECVAVSINSGGTKKGVAIIGRAFTKAEDYRIATEKAISGDWSSFAPSAVFENVLLTGSQSVEMLAKKFAGMDAADVKLISAFLDSQTRPEVQTQKPAVESKPAAKSEATPEITANKTKDALAKPLLRLPKISEITKPKVRVSGSSITKAPESKKTETGLKAAKPPKQHIKSKEEISEQAVWRSLFGDILDLSYSSACKLILAFLKDHYRLESLAWLENHGNRLSTTFAVGALKDQKIQIGVSMDDPRMRKLLYEQDSIELRAKSEKPGTQGEESTRLFPISVGGEIRSALVIGVRSDDKALVDSISRFCKMVTTELEILRLREELTRRSWLDIALKKFSESLTKIDNDDFWVRLMQSTAELLQAERGSLLIYDEKEGALKVKAAIGRKADLLQTGVEDIGSRIAKGVWKEGEALLVRNMEKSGFAPSPAEWNYRTGSFISYPLVIGERRIGVLNIADKVDGTPYTDRDVQILNSVIPQIAVAADRANLKNKAGEYEQLSVTDPLTGLLNRRYLEERLAEEIKRSGRHGYPMSFMMIDVDDFKSYNDQFLHPEGDKALKIVGFCLRETLRGADVAARYGGEEFSILLPQTNLAEAKTIAERIRGNIESADFPHRQVTVSIGIATISQEISTVEKLIECADKALFDAKKEGKNQVNVFKSSGAGQRASIH